MVLVICIYINTSKKRERPFKKEECLLIGLTTTELIDMLLEGYLANLKNYPKDEIKIYVTRTTGSILAPSWELLNDYQSGKIDWTGYERRYINEMANPKAIRTMLKIKSLSEKTNVRLICYEKNPPCHRFILLRMILGTEP